MFTTIVHTNKEMRVKLKEMVGNVARVQFVYSSNYYLKTAIKMLKLSQSLSGSHEDFQTKQYYGWQNYPYNTKLINKFRSLYGTK